MATVCQTCTNQVVNSVVENFFKKIFSFPEACAAGTRNAPLFQLKASRLFSSLARTLRSSATKKSLSQSLSLKPKILISQIPSFSPASMATSGSSSFASVKRSTTTSQASVSKRTRMASPPAASALPVSATIIPASLEGMGFASLPPLPLLSKTFGFLKCVNLNSVGLGLTDIPPEFGWDLVLFEPITEQSGAETQPEFDDDMSGSEEGSAVLHNDSWAFVLAETGSASVPDPRRPQIEPKPVFEDRLDDFSERVADIDLDEEPETPIEIVQTRPVQIPQTSEGPRKAKNQSAYGTNRSPACLQNYGYAI